MSEAEVRQAILHHIKAGRHLTLFLDFDGTLVPIAPTPAQAIPDQTLLDLLTKLSMKPWIRTFVLSGRPLDVLQSLLPIDRLMLCGLYGIEMRIDGKKVLRGPPFEETRHSMVELMRQWTRLINGSSGFLLEDKGQALALHARWADSADADRVVSQARATARELIDLDSFRILEGDRFLEVAPMAADKGATADWLLTHYPVENDLPISFGDDNKDEGVFPVVQRHGGFAIGVGNRYSLRGVDIHLQSPEQVRQWLWAFLESPRD
ncbi:MAG: trehalose-phosphatase [Anaerolineales bacterium]